MARVFTVYHCAGRSCLSLSVEGPDLEITEILLDFQANMEVIHVKHIININIQDGRKSRNLNAVPNKQSKPVATAI